MLSALASQCRTSYSSAAAAHRPPTERKPFAATFHASFHTGEPVATSAVVTV
jgi:hypothetical protein